MSQNKNNNQIPAWLNLGHDQNGKQVVIFVPALMIVEAVPAGDRHLLPDNHAGDETVTLTMSYGVVKSLNPEHSKSLLEKLGLRAPDSNLLVVPDVASKLGTPL